MKKVSFIKVILVNIIFIFIILISFEFFISYQQHKHELKMNQNDYNYSKKECIKTYFRNIMYHYQYFLFGYSLNDDISKLSNRYFNKDIFRKTIPDKKVQKAVILTGCSFTYGSGLQDWETFSYELSNYIDTTVYNLGVSSGSLREMLYILRNRPLLSTLTDNNSNISYIIYTYIPDHIHRLSYDSAIVSPYYVPVNNFTELKYKKKNRFFISSYIYKKYADYWQYSFENEKKGINLFYLYISEISKEIKKNYVNTEFIIFVYDDKDYINWEKIEKTGVRVIKAKDIVEVDLNDVQYQISSTDSHPNNNAWKIVVPKLVSKLDIR